MVKFGKHTGLKTQRAVMSLQVRCLSPVQRSDVMNYGTESLMKKPLIRVFVFSVKIQNDRVAQLAEAEVLEASQ